MRIFNRFTPRPGANRIILLDIKPVLNFFLESVALGIREVPRANGLADFDMYGFCFEVKATVLSYQT